MGWDSCEEEEGEEKEPYCPTMAKCVCYRSKKDSKKKMQNPVREEWYTHFLHTQYGKSVQCAAHVQKNKHILYIEWLL